MTYDIHEHNSIGIKYYNNHSHNVIIITVIFVVVCFVCSVCLFMVLQVLVPLSLLFIQSIEPLQCCQVRGFNLWIYGAQNCLWMDAANSSVDFFLRVDDIQLNIIIMIRHSHNSAF